MESNIFLGNSRRLTLEDCNQVARHNIKTSLHKSVSSAMKKSQEILIKHTNDRQPIYGLNTQFGSQSNILDTNLAGTEEEYSNSLKDRQKKLVESHNCGLGEEVPQEIVRGTMMLRAHCLALGHSGVRSILPESLVNFLNYRIHPTIHRYGSIGASGDLIPLSAIAAALMGLKAEVEIGGERMEVARALEKTSSEKLELEAREGLALINGTSFSTATASLAAYDLQRIFTQMLSALAMTLESLAVISSSYNPIVHKLKHHKGEIEVNDFFVEFWKGTKLNLHLGDIRKKELETFKSNSEPAGTFRKLQDYYSLRSVPQGFGPFKENLDRVIPWIEDEMNSVNDNPITSENPDKVCHTANFMGYYITEACDILKMDIAQASSWIHAILANVLHARKSFGLPTNLIENPGIDNGFRPLQILAASLTVQNRKLAQAQQAYMLPTEGDNQDVNSLSMHSAFDFREAVEHLESLVAILFLAGAQALDFRGIEKASTRSQELHKKIRERSSFIDVDRSFGEDIRIVTQLMREGRI